MKIKFQYIGLLALLIGAVSCKKDNFKAPSSTLSGKILYQGEAIQVEHDRVSYELYQYGFGKVGAIAQTFTQEGTYSSLLFDGQYKLIIPNGQGPFKWKQTASGGPDSLAVTVNGNQALDLEVTPYYMIRTPQITTAGGKVTASFKAEKIIVDATGKDIERVSLYINKTQFVSVNDNIQKIDLAGSAITDPNNISLELTIPTLVPTQNYVFARIAIKIAGLDDSILSPLQKITF
ncbi:MAG: DUF3823 domain-containing protein [Ferruginibacter sp.]